MNAPPKSKNASPPLPLQPDLTHRGGLGPDVGSLFPPSETFAALGGREAVARLVDGLYDRIERDAVLRPAFNRDLTQEREKQKLFFEAWFGGSQTYFDGEWRPGLKASHGPVTISRGMAGRWVGHFLDSLAELSPDSDIVALVKPLISRLAMALVNRVGEPVFGERLRDSCFNSDPRFLRCIQRDDVEGIAAAAAEHPQMLLRQGPRLLLVAGVRGKARAVEALLHQRVDVNSVAILAGSEATLQRLPQLPMTALCGALAKRRSAVADLLIRNGAQYDIFTASCLGDLDAIRQLLDTRPELVNADDPASDVARMTPLAHAVYAGQGEAAQLLFQRGAVVGENGLRLARSSANSGQEALTDLLLEYGVDPTAIGAGAWVLYSALADKLRDRGANVNAKPGLWIGLCCTGNSGHKENEPLARALLHYGADVTARYKGRTALHCAAKAGFARIVAALIEYGADVNAMDDDGRTPLDAVEEAGSSIDRAPVRHLLMPHRTDRTKEQ